MVQQHTLLNRMLSKDSFSDNFSVLQNVSFSDIDSTLYLVRDSKVAPMLQKPLGLLVPPIVPSIKDIRFKFNSSGGRVGRIYFNIQILLKKMNI